MRRKRTEDRGIVYANPFMKVRHSHVEFGDHSKDYYVVEFGPRAGVILRRDGRVLLVRQYRFLVDGLSWELPGGTVDAGEDLQVGARRECAEETGIECLRLEPLLVYYPGLDNVDNRTTVFLCDEFRDSQAFRASPSEVRSLEWVALPEAMGMIRGGRILDAMTIAGLQALSLSGEARP
jgi:8-oxo-dGTP pyrophosphatase MutT (NUDIX family)